MQVTVNDVNAFAVKTSKMKYGTHDGSDRLDKHEGQTDKNGSSAFRCAQQLYRHHDPARCLGVRYLTLGGKQSRIG